MTIVLVWFEIDSDIKLEGFWAVQTLTGSIKGLEAKTTVIES